MVISEIRIFGLFNDACLHVFDLARTLGISHANLIAWGNLHFGAVENGGGAGGKLSERDVDQCLNSNKLPNSPSSSTATCK